MYKFDIASPKEIRKTDFLSQSNLQLREIKYIIPDILNRMSRTHYLQYSG